MKITYLLSFLLMLMIMHGCTFKPSGEQFEQLDPTGKEPRIEVNLNFATDTILIQKNEWIYFSYKLNGDKVNWAQFIIDGQETSINEGESGAVQLSWYFQNHQSGTFPLVMKISTQTGTGSIADKVGAEYNLITRKWILVITDSYNMGSNITKTAFVDGSLKIDWEIFKGMDFKNYKLYKDVIGLASPRILVTTINSQEQTSFVDPTYHGEESMYYIVVNDEFYDAGVKVSGPLPLLTASNKPNGDIFLKWNKPPYYKNLKGYRLFFRDETGKMQPLMEINNIEIDSCIVPSPRFAYYYELYLTVVPLSDNYYDEWNITHYLSSKVTASYGVVTPKFGNAIGGMAPLTYFLSNYQLGNNQSILVFDHQKFTTTKKIEYKFPILNFAISSNNKYLVSVLETTHQLYLDDQLEPGNNKMLDLLTAFPLIEGGNVSVSNIGTGTFLNGQTAVLYDYIHELKLGEIKLTYNGIFANKISPDGNFFFCETYGGYEYFEYKDQKIISLPKLNEISEYILHANYLPGNNQKLVRAFSNRVEVLDCNTWTIEKQWQFDIPIKEVYNLDFSSGKLFLRQANNLILLDLEKGTTQQILTTEDTNYANKWSLIYNNNQVLWGEGKGIDLSAIK